ncbi:polyamine aminopropyltransferase [Pasteuria penetrans]|uniref:polyamine aminopropyltransferase n=1 Tax=Pasteuria penetrans TaxID=86005 RepID=UPI0011EBB845|nr:polyamine aminopropyltransferase [Pasteuria penetrans]
MIPVNFVEEKVDRMANKGLWYKEFHNGDFGSVYKMEKIWEEKQTPYQKLEVIQTTGFGKAMLLDNVWMFSEFDEFVYHEMLTHVPMFTHPQPRRVLVVGGGDGGTVGQVLRHPTVEEVVLVEIDEEVIHSARRHFPSLAKPLSDDRCTLQIGDGFAYVRDHKDSFDVILIDSTDDFCEDGFSSPLFTREFYGAVHQALRADGVMAAQTDSPWLGGKILARVLGDVRSLFSIGKIYLASIPFYPAGLWTFTIGSKRIDPSSMNHIDRFSGWKTRYYTPRIHEAAFVLPPFLEQKIHRGEELCKL